jgi:uncharacterized protein (DUF736 family)
VGDRSGWLGRQDSNLGLAGTALRKLGERESGTARLEEAVAAYRAALEESRIGCGGPAAWNKSAEKTGKAYISANSPFLPAPVNVALFPAKEAGKHVLVWDR